MTTLVIGCTGFTGGEILKTLLASSSFPTVATISRRAPAEDASHSAASTSSKLNVVVETDCGKWADAVGKISPPPRSVLSALGTTKRDAGSVEAQWKIDHDLNIALAKAARAAGATTFVFVSSGGTRGLVADRIPYSRMKAGVEDAVAGMGFDNVVILRPGLIMGRPAMTKPGEGSFTALVNAVGWVSGALKDKLGQQAEVIARAAVHALKIVEDGKAPDRHWVLEGADIVRLGRDEWQLLL